MHELVWGQIFLFFLFFLGTGGGGYLDIKELCQDGKLDASTPTALHTNPLAVVINRLPEYSSRVGPWIVLNSRSYNLPELCRGGEPVCENVRERAKKARVVIFHYPQDHGSPVGEKDIGGVRVVGASGGEGCFF